MVSFGRGGIFAIAALAVACAINPVTGRRGLNLVSEEQEVAIGLKLEIRSHGRPWVGRPDRGRSSIRACAA